MMERKLLEVEHLETYHDAKMIHFINPKDILYVPIEDFTITCMVEKVSDGDWDLDLKSFESIMYRGYQDVFFNGKRWEETELFNGDYQAGVTRILGFSDMCQEEVNVWKKLRCGFIDFIFRAMSQFGYHQDPYADFVSISIGRDGEIILNNGRHRLAAAQLLEIPLIPILIDVRHTKWVEFRESILEYAKKHNDTVYAPLKHVDLQDIPSRQSGRAEDILTVIHPSSKTVLDLGANWGYMCQVLEDSGRICTAVESDDVEFSFLEKLRLGYRYDMVHADICDYSEYVLRVVGKVKFDCVLALSIFHHLAKTEEGFSRLLGLLS
ncbi:hypothetical protein LCGC14_2623150, partial [marine sediment metagenome]